MQKPIIYNKCLLKLYAKSTFIYIYICSPYFADTELDSQKARAEFINKNTKTE